MNDQLVETLLYRSEDPSVDFKAEQYVFSKLDAAKYPKLSKSELAEQFKDKKSELLKDILAMSNAWRDGAAYILIGFKENKPNPPILVGIDEKDYCDDAAFQQFIAGKINKKREFKYEVRPYKGKTIGVLTIPKQARPFYSQVTFGKVKAGVVYVRRGSSTMEADPTEIASMGAAEMGEQREAVVDIALESESGEDLTGQPHKIHLVEFGDISKLPDYAEPPMAPFAVDLNPLRVNSEYWRELATWVRTGLRLLEVHFTLVNRSQFSLSDCKVEVDVVYENGERASLETGRELPRHPTRRQDLVPAFHGLLHSGKAPHSVKIHGKPGSQLCVVRVDKILAGETLRVDEGTLAVLPAKAGKLLFRLRLLAQEIPAPVTFERIVTVEATRETMDMSALERFARSR